MKAFVACIAVALVACASAEPPSGYNYNRPSGGGGGGFHGGSGLSGGGSYRAVSSGYQTSEGQNVDAALLEQIRQILLKEESSSSSSGIGISAPSSSYGVPSSSYGVPSSSYGVPHGGGRVVGINLEGIRQAIQVAQYEQSASGGGYPSGPSSSYGTPSGSYGAPY
ncbi:keratin, type I cytoskeletal 9 [Colias croceus]|uniref:keratin, type I cytoskeletal 9 n=1 Tax=Colias crocea TaxID=72248 RepID=UPI001E27BDDC|nr:keratin, type I cytoskeletal 9 [Colias croceus]